MLWTESDTAGFALWSSRCVDRAAAAGEWWLTDMFSQLGLCLCYCEDRRRSAARAACGSAHPGVREDLEGRGLSLLGAIVRQARFPATTVLKHPLCSFRILITGSTSGLVETITDAVSIHSIKKAEYARRLAEGRLGHVSLFDHFRLVSVYACSQRRISHTSLDLWRPVIS